MATYPKKLSKGVQWFYKFDLGGKTYRSNAIYNSKQEAKQEEAKAYQEAHNRQKHPTQQDITLLQAMTERLDYIQVRKTKKYYNDNKRYFNRALNKIGDVPISTIRKVDIETLLQEQSTQGAYAANSCLRALKALFNQAIDNHDLSLKNPCLKIKLFAVEKRLKYIPTDEDINTLLGACTEAQRRLIEFIRDTGARINEALNLTGRDVTNVEVTLYTRKSANSNLVGRTLDKPDCLVGWTFPADKRVFGDWTEQPKFLERKLKKLNLKPWGFHNLRHRYASILSAENVPIYEIMKRLGHSSIDTTQIYLQMLPKFRNDFRTITRETKAS